MYPGMGPQGMMGGPQMMGQMGKGGPMMGGPMMGGPQMMGPMGKGGPMMGGPQMMGGPMMGKGGPMPGMPGKGMPGMPGGPGMMGPGMMGPGMMGKGGPMMGGPQMMGQKGAPMPQQQPQAAPQPQQGLNAATLAAAPPQVQKQMIGEKLFPAISKYQPELAGKITGMMLEMDNSELLILLESEQQLKNKVDEALRVLEGTK